MNNVELTEHPLAQLLLQMAQCDDDDRINVLATEASAWLGEHPVAARELLLKLVDDTSLRSSDSLGRGEIPIIAAEFLSELSQPEIIAPLLELLLTLDDADDLFDSVWDALHNMGPALLEPTLAFIAKPDSHLRRGEIGAALLGDSGLQNEQIYQVLIDKLSHSPMMLAIYLGDYGDKRALPHLYQALNARTMDDPHDEYEAEIVNELAGAIHDLGGVLTDEQEELYQRARSARSGSGDLDTAFHRLARLAEPPAAEVSFTRFIWISAEPDHADDTDADDADDADEDGDTETLAR